MKFVKILHYVETSYEGKPSFVILMSDNKEYISNGCVWVENTQENIKYLIKKYKWKKRLEDLFKSPSIDMKDVKDARYMFARSSITEFDSNMSSVINASYMFAYSDIINFNGDMRNVVYAGWMFAFSNIRKFSGNMCSETRVDYMFSSSKLQQCDSDMTRFRAAGNMFFNTPYKKDLDNH